jgi:hypothetical protein
MPQVLTPTKVITKDGEIVVKLEIDLTINLNANGQLAASVSGVKAQEVDNEDDDVKFIVPTFNKAPKVEFGKNVKLEEV